MVKNISGSNANQPLQNLGNKELSNLQKTEVAGNSVLSQLASSIETTHVSQSQSLLTSSVQQTSSVTNNPSDTEIAENEYKIYQSLYTKAKGIISPSNTNTPCIWDNDKNKYLPVKFDLPRPNDIGFDYFQNNPDFLKNLISTLSNTKPCIWDKQRNFEKNVLVPINKGPENLDFDFSGLGLTTIPPGVFNNMDNNIRINLFQNNLTSLPQDFLNDCPNVYRLDLSNNNLTSLPEDFLNGCCQKEVLDGFFDFSNNQLNSLPENFLMDATGLGKINLINNSLTSLPNNFLKNAKNLRVIGFQDNNIPPDTLQAFKHNFCNKNTDIEW